MTTSSNTIFIVGGDRMTAISQKTLLETQNKNVRIFTDCKEFLTDSLCQDEDIVILDIAKKSPDSFRLLDLFLNANNSPNLIVTTFEKHIFDQGDQFSIKNAVILFKPFHPDDLVRAIEEMISVH